MTDKLTDRDRLLNEYESKVDSNNERCDKLAVQVRDLQTDIHGRDGRISNLTDEVSTLCLLAERMIQQTCSPT